MTPSADGKNMGNTDLKQTADSRGLRAFYEGRDVSKENRTDCIYSPCQPKSFNAAVVQTKRARSGYDKTDGAAAVAVSLFVQFESNDEKGRPFFE
jgi:hypothetical protein